VLVITRAFLEATSSHGVGVRTDSVAYLWGAENLAKGLGLGRLNGLGELKPMTHWPPFYPLLLTLFELAGIPALAGARYLGAVLVAADFDADRAQCVARDALAVVCAGHVRAAGAGPQPVDHQPGRDD
jgi:hypothetical protein